MAVVTLFYRDADNYKCTWDATVPDAVMRSLPPPDPGMDDMHDIRALGLSLEDIPLIAQYGYDDTSDHPFVTIENIQYEEGE